MNLENMKKDFPQMPEEMRLMVEREVMKQLELNEDSPHTEGNVYIEGEASSVSYESEEQQAFGNGYTVGEGQNSGEYRVSQEHQNGGEVRSAGERRSTGELHATGSRYADGNHHADGRSYRAAASHRNPAARRARKLTVLIAAAVALIGTTVFAGVNLSQRFFTEAEGTYGQKISIGFVETEDGTASDADNSGTSDASTESSGTSDDTGAITLSAALAEYEIPTEIPADVTIEATYIPEGMVQYDDGLKMDYEDALWSGGGISMGFIIMDDTVSDTPLLRTGVLYSEELTINGHYAVYLEVSRSVYDTSKIIYILYPEVWRVLVIFIGDDLSQEEAMKVAEGLILTGSEEAMILDEDTYTWSDAVSSDDDDDTVDEYLESVEGSTFEASLHGIGDTYTTTTYAEDAEGNIDIDTSIDVQVSDVQVTNSLTILENWETSPLVDDSWREAADEDGTLLPVGIDYIKSGDGINTIDTVVKTEEADRKLVYTTVEFTNTQEITLYNILFYVSLMDLTEEDGEIVEYDRISADETEWDKTTPSTLYHNDMPYYDVQGGTDQNGTNYITCLEAGESVTIHFAWLVTEDELPYLYLNINGEGNNASQRIEQGYVDIRQIG